MGAISRLVDRALHTYPRSGRPVSAQALALQGELPVVDMVVGSALFRQDFLERRRHGHVDLPRLREGNINLVGLTIATRHPDLRGTLSGIHFRSLGLPAESRRRGTNMAIAEWLIGRIRSWCEGSGGRLRLVTAARDIEECLKPDGPVGAFVGVQGGHVLDGDPANVRRLHDLGVRMVAPAHVMDNALVGSGTGVRRGGLTGYGREVIAALEESGTVVDLAHMSPSGIADSLAVVRRPFVLSHTGLLETSSRGSRWRRYSPATRNIPLAVVADVAAAGGVVGIALASDLVGGDDPSAAARTVFLALERVGIESVGLGSDLDGGLRAVVDASRLARVTDDLLRLGVGREAAAAFLGGNALRILRPAFGVA